MFRFGALDIFRSIKRFRRVRPVVMLALVLTLVGGGIGNISAAEHPKSHDLTARPQLKTAPQKAESELPRQQPRHRVLERHAVGIIERLDLTGPAERVEGALSGVTDAVRDGADKAWSWWNGDGGNENVGNRPHRVKEALPHLMMMTPIKTQPAQTRLSEFEDPYETINRLIFGMNSGFQAYILGPFAILYQEHTTHEIKRSVGYFFSNLREPVTIASSTFAGNLTDAGNATARFGINTTLGIGGLFDPATGMGYLRRPYDFEALFCQYGLPSGPYVVLPLLGPATARDAVARLLTVAAYVQVMGPSVYLPYRVSDIAVGYAGIRDKVEHLNSTAIDPYVIHRRLYLAGRNKNCGKPTTL